MKKLLSLLGAISLTATVLSSVVACNKKEENNKNSKFGIINGFNGEIHRIINEKNKLYVGTKINYNKGKLYSVDLENKNEVTEITGINGEVDALIAFDNKLYVGTVTDYISDIGKFYCVDLKDNNKITEISTTSFIKGTIFSFSKSVNNNYIYFGTILSSFNGGIYSVDLKDNNKITKITEIDGAVVRLIIENNKLYASIKIKTGITDGHNYTYDGELYSVDLKDNNKITKINKTFNGVVYGLVVINDAIYIGETETSQDSKNSSKINWFKM
ncbi:lipoprotein [Spiroplasma endosymbiont of Calodromius spilotus]|uniref:lipoprotein n=1 Tax=Spiroplasma endosymbiont of Calodromius spilotus TaxID=3077929 RepID=UPI0031FF1152